ncbi:MAG: hypothetical protein OER88_13805 [Planctomycetota bacterium]|nr:hypothetical protein [Planctomycetota bacterium]
MRLVWILISTVAVVTAATAPFLWPFARPAEDESASGPPPVELERPYYVLLPLLEVAARDPDGDGWDTGDSPPDLYYEVFWQGQRVFKSATKDDTFVAKWSNSAIKLGDIMDAVSIDDSIKAARVTARANQPIEFVVYDADIGSDEVIGRWKTDLGTLRITDQKWVQPAPGIVSAVCRVIPLDGVRFDTLTK